MTHTTSLGQRQPIQVAAIEAELAALWRYTPDDTAPQLSRACVMTLVVLARDSNAAQLAASAALRLTDRFPNRTILIDVQPDAEEDALDAWVQANCRLPAAGRAQVCCEQITISAHGSAVAHAANLVLPLLVPDVPAVLWWPAGSPLASPLFERLRSLADRLIIDSATFAAPEPELHALHQATGQTRLSDLAWARLTPWRELLAQFFDAPSGPAELQSLVAVRVQYHAPAGLLDRVQPLLLVGWLASKLGWAFEGTAPTDANAKFAMRRADGENVEISLEPQSSAANSAARIAGVALHSASATFHVACSRTAHCALATARHGNNRPVQRVVRLENLSAADLLAEDLRMFGHDQSYKAALSVATNILQGT